MIRILLIALTLTTGIAMADDAAHEELVQQRFESIEKPGPGWTVGRSPLFPVKWPLDAREPLVLYQYLYAGHFTPGVADGIHVGSVWGVLLLAGKSSVQILEPKVRDLGIQGVRPVNATESRVYASYPSIEKNWHAGKADLKQLREFYCTWRKLNGVIAAEIVPRQKAFFSALGCK